MRSILTRTFWFGGIGGAVMAIGSVTLILLYTLVGDRTSWGAWITVWPPVVWGFVLLPFMIRVRTWVPPVLLILFLVSTTEWPRLLIAREPSDSSLRLISWNIGAGNRNWLEGLESYEPDIVLVQENFPPPESWDGFEWHRTFDPAILSRFPVETPRVNGSVPGLNHSCFSLTSKGSGSSSPTSDLCCRLQLCKLRIHGMRIRSRTIARG